ncbi:MAG TPA: c-type cytochrome biogenesis protein CcmI, partial [Albitalea sp.]|nr:c-type cytochrome biogenesis protein CcmI [Albitalea sp.]
APRSAALAAALALFVFGVAGAGYAWLGAPGRLDLGPGSGAAAAAADAASQAKAAEQVSALVDQLAERLKTRPDDAQGWQMLARAQGALGRQAEAAEAFRKAARLKPDDATLLADFAFALAMANNRSFDGEPQQLIDRALKADPTNTRALALSGSAAFTRKDYRAAVKHWERLAQLEPADSPFAEQIRNSIAQAREMAGLPAAAAPSTDVATAATPAASGPAQVSGSVSLAPQLQQRVAPDDTVFVYARGVDGQRVPLAILRKRVRDLPFQFTLDDSMAMSPAAKLSGVAGVVVGARISKSGNAMPQSGDLQGMAPPVAVGTRGLQIEIDREITR